MMNGIALINCDHNSIMILKLNLLLATTSLLLLVAADKNELTLASLCANNNNIKLTRLSQVRQLIGEAKSSQLQACDTYKSSLLDLDQLLGLVEGGRKCNLELVNLIRQYHLAFVATKQTGWFGKLVTSKPIPDALRHFFMSLCFQVSAECKMTLINNLEVDTKELISADDYRSIEVLEQYGATLLDPNTEIKDFDDIILLNEITDNLGEDYSYPNSTRLLVKIKTNQLIKDLMKACKTKFKPIYVKLILPLVKLSNLGYNYQGEMLTHELEELKGNALVRRWYNIVQTCEVFNGMEVFEDPEAVFDDRQALTLISGDEAEALRRRRAGLQESNDEDEVIEYEPTPINGADELWIGQNQNELEQLVRNYRTQASEADRIRRKFIARMFRFVMEYLKSGKVLMLVSNTMKDKFGGKASANEEILVAIDQMIEDEGPKGANKIDTPVSGSDKRFPSRVPARISPHPAKEDKTKFSTTLYNWTVGSILPDKSDLFWSIFTIITFLMVIMAGISLG